MEKGFTLLEVLTAVSIFSFIALGGFRLLNQTAVISNAGQTASENTRAYKKATSVITSDLRNAVNRSMPSTQAGNSDQAAFFTDRNFMLEFSRGAYGPSSGAARSNTVRIRYLLREPKGISTQFTDQESGFDLIRQVSAMDGEQQGVEREQLLLQNVEIATLRFMDENNAWHSQWPVPGDPKPTGEYSEEQAESDSGIIPKAVEIDIRAAIASGPILVAIRA